MCDLELFSEIRSHIITRYHNCLTSPALLLLNGHSYLNPEATRIAAEKISYLVSDDTPLNWHNLLI